MKLSIPEKPLPRREAVLTLTLWRGPLPIVLRSNSISVPSWCSTASRSGHCDVPKTTGPPNVALPSGNTPVGGRYDARTCSEGLNFTMDRAVGASTKSVWPVPTYTLPCGSAAGLPAGNPKPLL